MKKLVIVLLLFWVQQSFACIELENKVQVCPGETVYPEIQIYPARVGTVKAVNIQQQTLMVHHKSENSDGYIQKYSIRSVSIVDSCSADGICPGQTVYPDNFSEYVGDGAIVKAVNLYNNTIIVQSQGKNSDGQLYLVPTKELSITKGCLEGICVGDDVFPDSFSGSIHVKGTKVKAINFYKKIITVQDQGENSRGYLFRYPASKLSIINACIDYNNSARALSFYKM